MEEVSSPSFTAFLFTLLCMMLSSCSNPVSRALALTGGTPDGCDGVEIVDGFPVTGIHDSSLSPSVDPMVVQAIRKYGGVGAVLAVARQGRLVYARGYGQADRSTGDCMQPNSLFRIASLSKPITASAILKLTQDARLNLNTQAFSFFPDITPLQGTSRNPDLSAITVLHLLQHLGGWDRDLTFDPMFIPFAVSRATGAALPVSRNEIIRYMLDKPLQHPPGSRYAYSNFGYSLLGRIIEKASGSSYEDYVTSRVLAPAGINGMRIGFSLPGLRLPGEVTYYPAWDTSSQTVFPKLTPQLVPFQYGGFDLQSLDSHGGWVGSAIDVLRYATTISRNPASAAFVETPPSNPGAWTGPGSYYGLGWNVLNNPGGTVWYHTGILAGSLAYLCKAEDGTFLIVLFNFDPGGSATDAMLGEVQRAFWKIYWSIANWSDRDLFAGSTDP